MSGSTSFWGSLFLKFQPWGSSRKWVITAWLIASGVLVSTAVARWVVIRSGVVVFGQWVAMAGPIPGC